jgi:hypothetical protein
MFRFKSSISTISSCDVDFTPILTPKDGLLEIPETPLTSNQTEMLEKLKLCIPSLLDCPARVEREEKWLCEKTLIRYLKATKWQSVNAAQDRLYQTILWRRQEKPDEIDPKDMREESLSGKSFISGFDKYGRTILIQRPGFENTKCFETQIRHQIFNIEKAVRLSKTGTICIIIDFTNTTLLNVPSLSSSRKFISILQSHYPETLGLGVMLDSFYIVSTLWKMVQPFLDPITKEKIVFAKSTLKNGTSDLAQFIDQDQLAIMHGGKRNWEWKHDVYWEAINCVNHE